MKKPVEISVHFLFWVIFTATVYIFSKLFLQAKPDAPFGQHLFYVVFLELIMGLLFFYVTFFSIRWALRNRKNLLILMVILISLLVFFAYPASQIGTIEVMSSILPHAMLILLAIVFHKSSTSATLEMEKKIQFV